ncbi:MAG: ribonuclease HII [Candidatus Aegiribacteria sp.]|nr:ribonuclease HII [Candidatus Aegiribacteria sp.]MBD3295706.1 ribonuclease HII [Candidatus Fermentibacteria bacterium]
MLLFDEGYRSRHSVIAGIDEAGRGPLAGPLVAAAVVFPPGSDIKGVDDSKKLSSAKREELYGRIAETSDSFSTGVVQPKEIDRLGMSLSVKLAFDRAADDLGLQVDLFLVDGLPVRNLEFKAEFIVKGDSKSLSIAAASIIAKVSRDRMMQKAHKLYPEYGFDSNKGYGTRRHLEAIRRSGPCPIHRMSFSPMSRRNQLRLPLE